MRLTRRVSRCRPTPSVQVRSHINRSYHAARNHTSGYRMTSLSVPQLPDTCTWSPLIRSVRRLCPVTCDNVTYEGMTQASILHKHTSSYRMITRRALSSAHKSSAESSYNRAQTYVRGYRMTESCFESKTCDPSSFMKRQCPNDAKFDAHHRCSTYINHIQRCRNPFDMPPYMCTKCERSHAMH